ncbi:phosphofurin acidic cluster sorting protein KrT95D isoform X2 [Arctopsyche grandis]|uniref:phosphofurin acidic cluster sorting protein KrT95D isoform X2 n=1 Tax=Arctopsyche grandis TaxID=121162 RepID=UPI00406D9D2C
MRALSSGAAGPRPVPMKLFAAWEVDRTPANCDPRLCTLTITRLTMTTPLPGLSSVSLAARMHSSKRTLRSHEIPLPPNGALLDTELDLNFSLQYPHFVKRDGNRLRILLQRRKKYKNRTILGYKTLAEGIIRMDQVLQRSMDLELELCSESSGGKADKGDKDRGVTGPGAPAVIAKLAVHQLSSMPVDHDTKNNNTLIADRDYSDEEEEAEFSSVEDNDEGMLTSYTSNNQHRAMAYNKRDLSYTKLDREYSNIDRESYIGTKGAERDSDSEFENRHSKRKGGSRGKMAQRNLKQKFVALLKRFRVPEELQPGETRNSGALEGDREIDELFKELESLSCGEDSGQEFDTISISSTPKPSLRPFFASSRSLAHQDGPPTHPIPLENEQWWNRGLDRTPGGPDGSLLPYLDQDDNTDQLTSREQSSNDHQTIAGSPPKEKDEKKSRLFRSAVGGQSGGARKKQQSLTISTDQQLKPTPSDHSAQSPTNTEPRRSFLEQIGRVLGGDEIGMPDILTLVHPARDGASAALLTARLAPILPKPTLNPHNVHEVRALMQSLLNKICKVCNTSAKPIQPVKVVLIGPDALISSTLRAYVDLWALRPPDWGTHVRFYLVPLGVNYISRYLASMDAGYAILFGGEGWQSLCERAADGSINDANDLVNRINRYVSGSGPTVQLPIGEAMVTYRERSCDEDSSQIFVPFINDVRIGAAESAQHSVDLEEALGPPGGSPPAALRPSPPATPAPPSSLDSTPMTPAAPLPQHWEPLELHIDYWQFSKGGDSQNKVEDLSTRKKIEGHIKNATGMSNAGSNAPNAGSTSTASAAGTTRGTIKSTFRCLQVARLSSGVDPQTTPLFLMTYATKEKKQKIMRLGKKKEKDKDTDTGRSQTLENITRIICSSKSSHNTPLRVFIDGTEWSSVKFFQLSMQWQTHMKTFPVALLGAPLAPQELT